METKISLKWEEISSYHSSSCSLVAGMNGIWKLLICYADEVDEVVMFCCQFLPDISQGIISNRCCVTLDIL